MGRENEPQDTAHEVCFSPSLDNATAGCSAPVLARAGFSTPMATATTCATTRSRLWHAILSWTPCAISTLCFWRGRPVLATRRRFLNLQRLRRHGGIPTAVNRESRVYCIPSLRMCVRASTKRRRPLIRVLNASRMLRRPTKRRGRVCKSDPHDHAPTATLVLE